MNGITPHIVQYQGSKRMLAPQILSFMPRRFSRLIEPFAGMAAITIASAKQDRAKSYIINDLNEAITSILQTAVESPEQLYREYEVIWSEQFKYPDGHVAHFYKIRDEYNNGDISPAKMLYLLARCVKGSVRYGSNGNFNQSPDKRRNGTNPKTLKRNIDAISYYLKGKSQFYALDYHEILEKSRQGDLIYMDPPYQGTSNVRDSRYISGIDFDEFVEAIDKLNAKNVDFIISYDGICGNRQYGKELPKELHLRKVLLNAGLSSQSTLLGRKETTFEALYISRGLQNNGVLIKDNVVEINTQYSLFDAVAV
jgi:DNA adenine methylase